MITVAIPFAVFRKERPVNVRSVRDPLKVYYRAMYVAFASIRRFNPDVRLILATNIGPPPEWQLLLTQLGVSTWLVEFKHIPPDGFHSSFISSLFMMDVIEALMFADELLLIDPDVLCVRNLDQIRQIAETSSAFYEIKYEASRAVNGLSRDQAATIYRRMGTAVSGTPPHIGGEAVLLRAEDRARLLARMETAWQLALVDFVHGEPHLVTEEHLLGFASFGDGSLRLNGIVRRIWTAPTFRTIVGDEEDFLELWHLPAEKETGFVRLYRAAIQSESWFWKANDVTFRTRAASAVGIRQRGVARYIRDQTRRIGRIVFDSLRCAPKSTDGAHTFI